VYLTVAALVVLGAIGAYIAYQAMARIRHRKWIALAKRLGFTYRDKHYEWAKRFPFRLFDFGVRSLARNLVWSKTDTGSVALCDFGYWTRHWLSYSNRRRSQWDTSWAPGADTSSMGSYHRSQWQTVVVIESSQLHSPMVFVRRERVLVDWIKEKFGEPDIDFDDDEAFSDAYVVQGLVESEVKRTLTRRVRALLTQNRDVVYSVETNGPYLLVNCGRRIDPESCDDVLKLAIGLEKLLREYTPVEVAADASPAAPSDPLAAIPRPVARGWSTGAVALVIAACAILGGLSGIHVLHTRKELGGLAGRHYGTTTYRAFSPTRALIGLLVGGTLGGLTGYLIGKRHRGDDPAL